MHYRLMIGLAALIAFIAAPLAGDARAKDERHEKLKAAFILNFAKFTDWPSDSFQKADASIRVCVYDDGPLATAMLTIDGKQIGRRKMKVLSGRSRSSPEQLCHIAVFTDASIHPKLSARPGILTVGDVPDFARNGGGIELIKIGRQVRFQVNAKAIRNAELRMSSKLLRLATRVFY